MFHFEVVADWIDTLLMSNMPQWLALAIEFDRDIDTFVVCCFGIDFDIGRT